MTTFVSSANRIQSAKSATFRLSNRSLFTLLLCLAAFLAPQASFAQDTASFSGTVTDRSGSALVGANVKIRSAATGFKRDIRTDSTGHYLVPLLPVGLYTVRIDQAGFQSAAAVDQRLQIDESREINFSLSPATVEESVLVTGDAVTLETASPPSAKSSPRSKSRNFRSTAVTSSNLPRSPQGPPRKPIPTASSPPEAIARSQHAVPSPSPLEVRVPTPQTGSWTGWITTNSLVAASAFSLPSMIQQF